MASKKLALKVEGGSETESSVDVSPSDHLLELSRRAIAALPPDLGTRLPALRTLRVPHNRIAELTVDSSTLDRQAAYFKPTCPSWLCMNLSYSTLVCPAHLISCA